MSIQTVLYRFLAPLLFLVGGVAALAFGVRDLLAIRAASRWPSAEGVVESSEVRTEIRETRRDNRTRRYREYSAAVVYRFTVDGVSIRGQRVRFGGFVSDTPEAAERDVASYPAGSAVVVFYDPENPEDSVLERGVSAGAWILPGLGLAFLLAGLVMGYSFNR